MNAYEFLTKHWPREWLPKKLEGKAMQPSNSELWRLLDKGGVIINGQTPKPKDDIEFPIWELVFFPKGRKCTIIKEELCKQ